MKYKCLVRQEYTIGEYQLVPIRFEDRFEIMKWRNEQMYHLRQSEILTIESQDRYFLSVVTNLFSERQPNQVLFSYLKGNKCIGYGGLVHINWINRNAEISFIMDTLEENVHFEFHWKTYLKLIEEVAFLGLDLHKIFTFAFDLRPRLYRALEEMCYEREARLKEHCFFESKYIDVVIHCKVKNDLHG
jgi:RimJ/RimL family protein N-acetyltransferase